MAKHGENWKHLPEGKKNEYDKRAKIARELKRQQLNEDKTELKHAIDAQRQSVAQTPFRSMAISACKLSEGDRAILQKIHDSSIVTASNVRAGIEKGVPEMMSEEAFRALIAQSAIQEFLPLETTTFLTQVAGARDQLRHTVFCLQDDEGRQD
eukprot:2191045-Amphidinium_carterae.1